MILKNIIEATYENRKNARRMLWLSWLVLYQLKVSKLWELQA